MTTLAPMVSSELADLERLEREFFAAAGDELQARCRARRALLEIYTRELYRAYGTWETYCANVLKRNVRRAYEQVWWANVEQTCGAPHEEINLSYRQVVALAEVAPERRGDVYHAAQELAGDDSPTPTQIADAEAKLDEAATARRINRETRRLGHKRQRRTLGDRLADVEKWARRGPKKIKPLPAEWRERLAPLLAAIDVALGELAKA